MLLKLLHPHRSPDSVTRDELVAPLDVAVEMRKRVKLPLMVTGGFRSACPVAQR